MKKKITHSNVQFSSQYINNEKCFEMTWISFSDTNKLKVQPWTSNS